MRAEVYIDAGIVAGGRFRVSYELFDHLGYSYADYLDGRRRVDIVAGALQRECHHTTMTGNGEVLRWVARRVVGGAGQRVTLDVVEVARMLDRYGVAVPG